MDIRTIRCFIKTVNLNSINKAAQELYMNHQNLGKKLSNLEQELGLELLVRTKTGVSLTAEGEILYEKFQKLDAVAREIEEYAELVKQKQRNQKENSVDITIALQSSLFPKKVSKAVIELENRFPDCNISIRNTTMKKAVEMICANNNTYANIIIPESKGYIFPDDISVLKKRTGHELVAYVPKKLTGKKRTIDIYDVLQMPLVHYGITETIEENDVYAEIAQYGKPKLKHYSMSYTSFCDLMYTEKYAAIGWLHQRVKLFESDAFAEYLLNSDSIEILPIRYKGKPILADVCWISHKDVPMRPEVEFFMQLL